MSVPESTLRAVEDSLDAIGRNFAPETWTEDHDEAMKCRDLEERIAECIPLMNELAKSISVAEPSSVFGRFAVFFSYVDQHLRQRIRELQNAGFAVDRIGEWETAINPVRDFAESVWSIQSRGSPDHPVSKRTIDRPVKYLGPPLTVADLPAPGDRLSVVDRSGPIRLPDPPFETDEGPAPLDLPRPSGAKTYLVKTRPGPIRLPDPIDD